MSDTKRSRLLSRIAGAVAFIASAFMPVAAVAQVNVAATPPHVARAEMSAKPLPAGHPHVSLPSATQPEVRLHSDGVTIIVRAQWSSVFLYGVAKDVVGEALPHEALDMPGTKASPTGAVPPAAWARNGIAENETQWCDTPSPVDPVLAAEANPEAKANAPDPAGTQHAAMLGDPALWALTADGQPRFGPVTTVERQDALCQAAAWAMEERSGSHPFGYLGWDETRLSRALHLLRDVLKAQEPGKGWRLSRNQATSVVETSKALGIDAEVAATSATFWALPPHNRFVVLSTALKAGYVANIPQCEIALHVAVSEKTLATARRRGEPSRSHSSQRWVSKLKAEAVERARADYAAHSTRSKKELPAA